MEWLDAPSLPPFDKIAKYFSIFVNTATTTPEGISFKFAASPNATGLVVGDITGIAKKGWEYLWVRYADAEDTSAKVLVKKPIAAYVEQVYPYGNFAGLGIGV